jgi:hypothetical protein
MMNLIVDPGFWGVFGGRFKTSSTKVEALTSISAGQGYFVVGTAGFEPTTP